MVEKEGWFESKAREKLLDLIDAEMERVSADAKKIEDRTDVLVERGKDRDDWLGQMGVISGLHAAREIVKYGIHDLE